MFNSSLKLFPVKMRSRWSGSFIVVAEYPYGTVEVVSQRHLRRFEVNEQCLKTYWGGDCSNMKTILPLENAN